MADSSENRTREPAMPVAKAEGAFLALAAGDALGWPQEMPRNLRGRLANESAHVEFTKWTRRSGGRFQPYEEVIRPGDYSDDTQLTLAVARSRTKHGSEWWKALTRSELPLWMIYERGGGGATKRAAKAWARGVQPWKSSNGGSVRRYFEAGGNGVAMRVLPHALFLAGKGKTADLMHDVILDGSATHGHPRALVGAAVYAHAAWSLARRNSTLRFGELLDTLIDEAPIWSEFPNSNGERGSWFKAADHATGGYELIWKQTVGEMRELLEKSRRGIQAGALADDHAALKDLGCFGPTKGAGTISAAAVAYLAARHAAQPVQGILRAAFEKGADTDTLAAMTGGLMGCIAGVEWLPAPWLDVQDAGYLRSIARQIAMGPEAADQHHVERLANPGAILADLVREGEHEMAFGKFLQARATTLPNPRPLSKSISVRAWCLQTTGGQTMYVTKVDKLPPEKRPGRVTGSRKPIQHPAPGAQTRSTHTARKEVGSRADSKNALYDEFCRQWRSKFGLQEMKRKDVEKILDLVPSQVSKWLARAEQDGQIQRTSKNPAKFALRDHQQSLL